MRQSEVTAIRRWRPDRLSESKWTSACPDPVATQVSGDSAENTGIPVSCCDPHKPRQRGSNEHTNRLLRQYLPKGTDLSVHSATDLARIAHSLNDRPRKTLRYMTPSERLAELLAHTG